MKILLSILLLLAAFMPAEGQSYGMHWIGMPEPDSTSHVWFRHVYNLKERPTKAELTIATTGRCELFVNQWNVSPDVFAPFRKPYSDEPIAISYDITHYMQADSNVVAVWYAPSYPHIEPRQLSVVLAMTMPDGSKKSYTSNGDWLCKPATRSLTPDGGERQVASGEAWTWNSTNINLATWRSAAELTAPASDRVTFYNHVYPAFRHVQTIKPRYTDINADTLYFEFLAGFQGALRLTLRDAKRGERIYIDGLEYVCSGEMDEQVYHKFTQPMLRRVRVYGDKNFRREQIQTVEGLVIAPFFHSNYNN